MIPDTGSLNHSLLLQAQVSSCQMSQGYNTSYVERRQYTDTPVMGTAPRDHTRSPLRKKPHIRKESDCVPQGSMFGPQQPAQCFQDTHFIGSCSTENKYTPTPSSSGSPGKELTMADCKTIIFLITFVLSIS